MNVSVFGLGYVGSVSAASFAADGHTVVGVDVNPDKVGSLSEGRSPIVEKGLDELIRDNAANGRLRATTDTREAVNATDLSLICVGTPSRPKCAACDAVTMPDAQGPQESASTRQDGRLRRSEPATWLRTSLAIA